MNTARVSRIVPMLFLLGLALGDPVPASGSAFTGGEIECFSAIAKAGAAFDRTRFKLELKCRRAELSGGSCAGVEPKKLEALVERHARKIEQGCGGLNADRLAAMGYPGSCADPDGSDGFTVADLVACQRAAHTMAVDGLLLDIYDAMLGELDVAEVKCQLEIARATVGLVFARMRALLKCRLKIVAGQLGVFPEDCAWEAPYADVIAKATSKLVAGLAKRCSDVHVAALRVCTSDETTVAGASSCLPHKVAFHYAGVDDVEAPGPLCGDGRRAASEECDGPDDLVCPGACGDPMGYFACLCTDRPRQRVVESAGGDRDLGWSGLGHDQAGVAASYVVDLWDCDGPTGSDTECVVGPSCSAAPHAECTPDPDQLESGDEICAALGQGTCRESEGGLQRRHCLLEIGRRCTRNLDCPMPGDRCVHAAAHGPPLPLSVWGVPLCMSSVFAEDLVGSVDVATGAAVLRLRERTRVYVGGTVTQPCPVCGGFCEGPLGGDGPGLRTPCTTAADCAPGRPCVTTQVCSYGPNADQPCRLFGDATPSFGAPSSDCPPAGTVVSGSDFDLRYHPLTTGTAALAPSHPCADLDFRNDVCDGGTRAQRTCASPLDCPGGSCGEQCHCPGQSRPNPCLPACVGGANDAAPCDSDVGCDPPNGFCHPADCRHDASDSDSTEEGRCTVGPAVGYCSVTAFQACDSDDDCGPPSCPHCADSETCLQEPSQCFVNGTLTRTGTAGASERTLAAITCLPATTQTAVNMVLGLPGPLAVTRPEAVVTVP